MSVTGQILRIAPPFHFEVELIAAFTEVESSGIVGKLRFEPKWTYFEDPKSYAAALVITEETETVAQQCSWGPMQVMGSVARQHGFRGHMPMLASEYLGIYYGCLHLNWLSIKHGYSGDDLISAYNAGTPAKDSNGNYINKNYVDQIKKWVQYFKDHGVHDDS